MTAKIFIPDYGTVNLNSILRVFERLSVELTVSLNPTDITNATKIVLPGVGHFDTAMESLERLGFVDALNEAVLERKVPVLGICLGMEVMATGSEEGVRPGLGWIDNRAIRFRVDDPSHYKVPHMGWNTLSARHPSRLLDGVDAAAEFYFAHAYHLELNDSADTLAETEYESAFPSVIEKENIFGVQFHPEKSYDAGMRILRNFVNLS